MTNGLNSLDVVNHFFGVAARALHLDDSLAHLIQNTDRELRVEIPLVRDDGRLDSSAIPDHSTRGRLYPRGATCGRGHPIAGLLSVSRQFSSGQKFSGRPLASLRATC
jgi:hypothetical protein